MAKRVQVILALLLLNLLFCANAQIMYQQVLSMGFAGSLGSNPQTRLLAGSDGTLYGTTYQGGNNGHGAIFRINADGSGFGILHGFTGIGGARPYADLVFGNDGAIYGTTEGGGTNGGGIVFKIRIDGSGYQALFHFS